MALCGVGCVLACPGGVPQPVCLLTKAGGRGSPPATETILLE